MQEGPARRVRASQERQERGPPGWMGGSEPSLRAGELAWLLNTLPPPAPHPRLLGPWSLPHSRPSGCTSPAPQTPRPSHRLPPQLLPGPGPRETGASSSGLSPLCALTHPGFGKTCVCIFFFACAVCSVFKHMGACVDAGAHRPVRVCAGVRHGGLTGPLKASEGRRVASCTSSLPEPPGPPAQAPPGTTHAGAAEAGSGVKAGTSRDPRWLQGRRSHKGRVLVQLRRACCAVCAAYAFPDAASSPAQREMAKVR